LRLKNKYLIFTFILYALFAKQITIAQNLKLDSCIFFNNKPIYPYYANNSISNGKDFYTQKKEFKKAINAQTNFNGIITVIFFINDKGETNFYKTQLCDLNYKTIIITKNIEQLCSQILETVRNTSPWIPMLDESNQAVNCRKFYSFKFNNGQLIEILPK